MTDPSAVQQWFYAVGAERKGPVGRADLDALVRAGVVRRDTLVWTSGAADWRPAGVVPDLADVLRSAAPDVPPPPPPPPTSQPSSPPPTPGPWASQSPDAYDYAVSTYRPESFKELFTWFWICSGPGILLCFPIVAGIVLGFVLQYRFWAVIQKGGGARTSPGMAVGLSFVPLFNLYWNFVSVHGLAQDMNAYCRRNGIPGQVNETMALVFCIAQCVLIVPYLNLLVLIPVIVLQILLWGQCADVAAAIVRARRAATTADDATTAGALHR